MNRSHELPAPLARAHAWAHRQPWLRRFTLMNRLLLAMAFLPTGLVKFLGQRFTILPVENPIGFFFEAMYRTGPYWNFIGGMQVLAALLLLIPATASIGAVLFLPIGVSIFLVTLGVGFGNTVFVTGGMLLAVVYLLCWDADRLWSAARLLLGKRSTSGLLSDMHLVEKTGWILGGMSGMGLFLGTRGFTPRGLFQELFWLGVASAALVVLGWILGAVRGGPVVATAGPEAAP